MRAPEAAAVAAERVAALEAQVEGLEGLQRAAVAA